MVKVKIEPMQTTDLPEAVDVLGQAFATQPSSLVMYRGKTPLEIGQRMKLTFSALLKYLPGKVYVAKNNGRIVGTMRMVEWPDCQTTPIRMLRVLPTLMKAGRLGEIRRGMKIRSAWAKNDPKKPHWHLDPLGIIPDLQGQGIGSQMMEYYCNHVDKLNMAAYHETDRPENVKFYEKFGFKVIREQLILEFPNWYMWRSQKNEI